MLRSPVKLGVLLGGLAVASLPGLPAAAQNPTVMAPATNVPPPDARARMWAATARFVYGDDPALASLRPQLRQTIDSGSVNLFGRHLEDAVKLERKNLPKLEHVLKFQGDFKTISSRNEPAMALATSIANTLLSNKPERQNQPAFGQLRQTLHALADPNAPAPVPAPTPVAAATLPAGSDTMAQAAARQAAAVPPVKDFTITNTAPNPMLTYLALALSVISLLVSLFKGNSKKRHRSHDSAASPSLAALTEEMRAEVRIMVQREVSNKASGARPAPDPTPAAKPQAAAPAATAQLAPPVAAKAAPARETTTPASPMPARSPAPAVAGPVAAPATAEPAATTSTEDEDLFDIKYPAASEEVAAPLAAPTTRTLYANQQPINGIFQRNTLAEASASYSIFELTTAADTPNQARFVVTGNQAGHTGYIGSHVNILGGACEYPFPKSGVSRIVTDTPGVAQRTAGGDWQISKKAQIHFE
ncbi:hypothetical protein QMK33_20685 [Hymenobacter sp. H14-R3]|uniref:hypothetical protein n=1 Tax=Hymenobacter sp. H14-R3 TaxID=3046308 RepID=UPI0024B9E8BF|nr:hypothetical protein [Hymenobacter sp. H14-R3]MDJ0367570.1 hypothetical protein [Hymenobacter sp. H14-R3]